MSENIKELPITGESHIIGAKRFHVAVYYGHLYVFFPFNAQNEPTMERNECTL